MTSHAQFGFNHVCSYKEKSTYSYSYSLKLSPALAAILDFRST